VRPAKKPLICSGLRSWYGTAPVSEYFSPASWCARPELMLSARIVVDVDDPALGRDPLRDLVRVFHGRQPGADIEELRRLVSAA
jgi:hypothetical protein